MFRSSFHMATKTRPCHAPSWTATYYNGAMLLYEPPPSQADIHFRVLGIPVRVHPMFWVMTFILGVNPRGKTPPADFLSWIGVVFVSVLIHELGHALVQRYYGGHPRITLYSLGGLASCDDCDRGPWSQIVISLAGPAAGFLLAGLVIVALVAMGRFQGFELDVIPVRWDLFNLDYARANDRLAPADFLVFNLFFVNIVWGLVNLLPVYPLDGGRVSRELLTLRDPRRGVVASLWLSMIAAAGMAAFAILVWSSLFTAVMFGYMAYANHQTLRSYQ
jgi:stage IV sporulation protein FB